MENIKIWASYIDLVVFIVGVVKEFLLELCVTLAFLGLFFFP
jgi:hypothetical protein